MIKKLYRFLSPKFQTLFLEYHTNMVPRYGHGNPPHQGLYDMINAKRADYESILNQSLQYIPELQKIKPKGSDHASNDIVWNNGYLPGLDIAMIYSMLALKKPSKYIEVEVGS